MPQNLNSPLQGLIDLEIDTRKFGMDWPNREIIIDTAISECDEIREAISLGEPDHRIQEEIGDLLHTAISLCIFSGYDVNETLSRVTNKFGNRMSIVKQLTKEQGLENLQGQSFEFLLDLWKRAKELKA